MSVEEIIKEDERKAKNRKMKAEVRAVQRNAEKEAFKIVEEWKRRYGQDFFNQKEEYVIEKLMDVKSENGENLYFVKWEGYPL